MIEFDIGFGSTESTIKPRQMFHNSIPDCTDEKTPVLSCVVGCCHSDKNRERVEYVNNNIFNGEP